MWNGKTLDKDEQKQIDGIRKRYWEKKHGKAETRSTAGHFQYNLDMHHLDLNSEDVIQGASALLVSKMCASVMHLTTMLMQGADYNDVFFEAVPIDEEDQQDAVSSDSSGGDGGGAGSGAGGGSGGSSANYVILLFTLNWILNAWRAS